jgi:hypothetical protein
MFLNTGKGARGAKVFNTKGDDAYAAALTLAQRSGGVARSVAQAIDNFLHLAPRCR